jgi:hypothetical protein
MRGATARESASSSDQKISLRAPRKMAPSPGLCESDE